MARLASVARKGFYPLPVEVARMIGRKINVVGKSTIFDPCAGEGVAVRTIAEEAGIPASDIYMAELDIGRSEVLRQTMPGSTVFGPVDFLGAYHYGSVSIAYVNPPFDNELGGGGRIEWKFIDRAIDCVAVDGLVVIVIPESVARDHRTGGVLHSRLDRIQIFELPKEHREFREVVVFGTKRKDQRKAGYYSYVDSLFGYGDITTFDTVEGKSVVVRKITYTDEEMLNELSKSEAQSLFKTSAARKNRIARPPMEMRKGHRAMLLASGFLDGVVDVGDGDPHVVRGSAVKKTDKKEEKTEDGIRVTETERIYLVVKVATSDGRVVTLTDRIETDEDEPVDQEVEVDVVC